MPATTTAVEKFPIPPTTLQEIEEQKKLRIKAGAIRSSYIANPSEFILTTEWNVIGENDS